MSPIYKKSPLKKSISSMDLSDHDKEHKHWNRRSFLQALGLVGSGSMMLAGSSLAASKPSPLSVVLNTAENGDRVLVLIRLKGGNDGLNTIVPLYDYDTYASQRPSIRFDQNTLYKLSPDFGIPAHMQPLQSLWGEGKCKVVHGVGYQDQNLSHFRSSDIWASGEETDYVDTGVLGRYFENLYPDFLTNLPQNPPAIQIGSIGNLLFEGDETNYAFSVSNPDQLEKIAESGTLHDLINLPDCLYGEQLGFMRSSANTTFTYAGVIHEAYNRSANSVQYGEGNLANQLAIIARMIKGNLGTKIYMVTIDGFDTHANQKQDHENLMRDLSDSVQKFYEDLANTGMDDQVISMTFSEFGRRIFENGSGGTDHGAAATALLFGPALGDNGFIGNHPDLSDPEGPGNLRAGIDFRSIYATVLKEWLCLDPDFVDTVLLQGSYHSVSLGFSCNGLSVSENPVRKDQLTHIATYKNRKTYLELEIRNTHHLDIRLYDIMGKEIGILKNEVLTPGNYSIDIENTIKRQLSMGQYIYRIVTNRQKYSRSIMIL